MFRKLLVTSVLSCALVMAAPLAAHADGYLDEATQALQSGNLYVSPQVTNLSADQVSALDSQIGSADIAIVVLPANASSEIGSIPSFLSDLAGRTGYDTILVSVGGDFEAGSSALPAGTASQLANAAEGGDLYGGLSEFVTEAIAETPNTPANPGGQGGFDAGPVLGVGGAILGLAAIGTAIVFFVRRRGTSLKLPGKNYTPDQLHGVLNEIRNWASKIEDRAVAQTLRETEGHVRELFKRVRKNAPDMIQQVTAQYKGVLNTVKNVSDRFADIEEHPLYWKRADELLTSGRRAIEQYKNGVIQNIQEINEGSLTDFRVDTKILEATVKQEEPDYLALPVNKKERR